MQSALVAVTNKKIVNANMRTVVSSVHVIKQNGD